MNIFFRKGFIKQIDGLSNNLSIKQSINDLQNY